MRTGSAHTIAVILLSRLSALAAILCGIYLTGCANAGRYRNYEADRAAQKEMAARPASTNAPGEVVHSIGEFRVGITTTHDITRLYGSPGIVRKSAAGEVWVYNNIGLAFIPFNFGYRYDEKSFTFDADGKLKDYALTGQP